MVNTKVTEGEKADAEWWLGYWKNVASWLVHQLEDEVKHEGSIAATSLSSSENWLVNMGISDVLKDFGDSVVSGSRNDTHRRKGLHCPSQPRHSCG